MLSVLSFLIFGVKDTAVGAPRATRIKVLVANNDIDHL